MANKKYNSHIDKPVVHTTSKGSSYVTPFDVIRSKAGREVINSHAAAGKSVSSQDNSRQTNTSNVREYKKTATK